MLNNKQVHIVVTAASAYYNYFHIRTALVWTRI
jgi:hypothetical protein